MLTADQGNKQVSGIDLRILKLAKTVGNNL